MIPADFTKVRIRPRKPELFMTVIGCAISRILVRPSLAVLVLLALAFPQHRAGAETKYPSKAVRIVLPFAAGGVADITARIVAERLGAKLGGDSTLKTSPAPAALPRLERLFSLRPTDLPWHCCPTAPRSASRCSTICLSTP
jgi:hypothetical protein